jgi:hypothetical protein
MKKTLLALLIVMSFAQWHCGSAKKAQQTLVEPEVQRIEAVLSHDSMEGRQTLAPAISKSVAFISNEMKAAGLKPFKGDSYSIPYPIHQCNIQSASININDSLDTNAADMMCITEKESLVIDETSGYKIVRIANVQDFSKEVNGLLSGDTNTIGLIDRSLTNRFNALKQRANLFISGKSNLVVVLTSHTDVTRFKISLQQKLISKNGYNLAGVIKGKKHPNEYVIFSAHYDHLGYGRAVNGDSLYNGANDDASGTTAVLMLAKYFAANKRPDRSILFVAFSGEELGLFGSKSFASEIDADAVKAMLNIEMIGTHSKWGKNAAYITGYERSDLGKILEKNLQGSGFTFYPDPYTQFKLFYRSDNASLAEKGVPAHTISTSTMDQEPHYHKPSDEIGTLDMANMTEIIKSIAIAASSVISGKDTPSRVDALKVSNRQ